MTRKRKLFLGVVPVGGKVIKSRRLARKITSEYHSLTKQIHMLDRSDKEDDMQQKTLLVSDLQSLGGTDRYQQASQISTKYHKV